MPRDLQQRSEERALRAMCIRNLPYVQINTESLEHVSLKLKHMGDKVRVTRIDFD